MEYSRRGLKRPPTRPSSYRGLEMRPRFGLQSVASPKYNDHFKEKRSNSGYCVDDDKEYVQGQSKRSRESATRFTQERLFGDDENDGYDDEDDENEANLENRASLIGAASSSQYSAMRQSSAAPSSSTGGSITSRLNLLKAGGNTATTLADTQVPYSFVAATSYVEATEYPNAVSQSKKKAPKKHQEQGGKSPMEMSLAELETKYNEDSEDEPEESDQVVLTESPPTRKFHHIGSMCGSEELTTPSSRLRSNRASVPIDQRNKVEKFLKILDEQNRLKCDTDADVVDMLFFLVENYDSKRRCVESFTDLLDARNPHLRPMLREYFIMHYLIRLRPQTAKKFGTALQQAVEYHLLDFVPSDLRPKLTCIFETYNLLDTISKMPNSRWLTNFVPDPSICLNPKLYCSDESGHTVPGFVNLLETADPRKLCLSILTWAQSVDDVNFAQLPLLSVNQEQGYVTNLCSMFFGLRNAETYEEWVSLLHYIVCVIIGNVHNAQLPSVQGIQVDKSFLSGRCLYAAKKMRSGHMVLHDLYQTVFLMRGASIWSMFWGSRFLWDAFKAVKMTIHKTCQVRIVTLMQQIVIKSINVMATSNCHKKLRLSVSSLIINPEHPAVLPATNKLGWSEQDFSIQGVESLGPLEPDEHEEN